MGRGGEYWSLPQRRAILSFLTFVVALLAFRLWRYPLTISDPQPPAGLSHDELATRIDPNTADRMTLAGLPGLGPALSERVIAYREQAARAAPGRPAFDRAEDLDAVPGIGATMVEALRPYLLFSHREPTSRPLEAD